MEAMKTFFSLMTEQRNRKEHEVKSDLDAYFSKNPKGITCPVPGCPCTLTFLRWGALWDHFLDNNHKRDFFKAYEQKYHRPFCDPSGEGFKHGVRSLMLAMLIQPTSLVSLQAMLVRRKKPVVEAVERIKKVRPVQEQQTLLVETEPPAEAATKPTEGIKEPPSRVETLELARVIAGSPTKKSAFSRLSDIIRDSKEINVDWRGAVYSKYVHMFHGIPPCFHCRSAEGKQIHHQNPLFHEIILIALNKWATTADEVMKDYDSLEASMGGTGLFHRVLAEVVNYHNQEGWVLAVPYCQECNQDAEAKRRKGR